MNINILVLIFILFSTGCSAIHMGQSFDMSYEVRSFKINLADWRTIKEEYRKMNLERSKGLGDRALLVLSPMGFCDPYNRIMWITGRELDFPDFDTLGHETWHFPELGGLFFHDSTGIIP